MLKKLKSKLLLGVMVVTIMFVGAFALTTTKTASAEAQAIITVADIQYAATVKLGSSGQAALIWQRFLNGYSTTAQLVEDGAFGPLSTVQAKAWQGSRGLTADGVLGALSRASAIAQIQSGAPASAFPAGCTSTAGYSSVTGLACAGVALPAGCTSAVGFSTTTGASCSSSVSLPAGCSSTAGYSTTTGASCSGGSASTGPLVGGAGDIDTVDQVTTSVKSEVLEGASGTKVLGIDVSADNGSDLAISSLRVEFENLGAGAASTHLNRYIDSVSVLSGSTKVGESDVADFSESNDVYSDSITLSNVVVKAGETVRLYVTVDAASTIDTNDQVALDWGVELISLRVLDAQGAILTYDTGATVGTGMAGDAFETFGFADLAGSGDLALKISKDSTSPIIQSVEADANGETDADMLVFKLKAEGSDMVVDSITVDLTSGIANLDDLMTEVKLMNGTDELDSLTVAQLVAAGAGVNDQAVFTDLADDLTIEDGDTVTLTVAVTINEIDGTPLVNGENLVVSLTVADTAMANMDVEDADGDQVGDGSPGTTDDRSGSATGAIQTFEVDTPTVALISKSLALQQAIDGVGAGFEDVFLAKFVFNITAGGDDIYISKGVEGDANYTDTVMFTRTGAGTINSQLLEADDETLDDGLTTSFLVTAGTTEKFTLSFYVEANNTAEKFSVDSIAYNITGDDAGIPYVYGSDITSNMASFATASVYLAE